MPGTVTVAALVATLDADTRGFVKGMDTASAKIGGFADKADRVAKKSRRIGNKLTVGLSAPLALLGGKAIGAAEDLGESVNAVETVFGDASETIFDFGQTAAESAGLAQRKVNQSATVLGASLTNAGLSADEAASSTVDLTKRAADMASVFNTDVDSALGAIQAGLRGEIDPLEKFGVSMNAAAVEAKAMELGLADATGEVSAGAKAQARLAVIMEQTEKLAGDFADTADETANAQRVAQARAEDLSAAFGKKLIPAKAKAIEVASRLLGWFEDLDSSGQNLAIGLGALGVAIGPVIRSISAFITAIKGANAALTFLAANPVVLAIAALAALAAGLVIAYQRSETFRDIVNRSFEAVMDGAKRLAANVIGGMRMMMDAVLAWAETQVGAAAKAFGWVPGVGDKLDRAHEDIKRFRDQSNEALSAIQTDLRFSADVTPAMRELARLREAARAVGGHEGVTVSTVAPTAGPLRKMQSGGVVEGPRGAPVPIIAHGGEHFSGMNRSPRGGAGGDIIINVHGSIFTEDELLRKVQEGLRQEERRSGRNRL